MFVIPLYRMLVIFIIHSLISGMAICNCTTCMGLVEGLHRNTIAAHQKKRGIAFPADIERAKRLRDGNPGPIDDDDESRGGRDGRSSDEDWEQDEDEEEEHGQREYIPDEPNWEDDPFFHELRPYVETLVGSDAEDAWKTGVTLDLLRWARQRSIPNLAMDELFALLKTYLDDPKVPGEVPSAINHKDAERLFKSFRKLKIRQYELCQKCPYRWLEGKLPVEDSPPCPECGSPSKDEAGNNLTCTLFKFDLKERLQLLYATPHLVDLLKSHAKHVSPDDGMESRWGTPPSFTVIRLSMGVQGCTWVFIMH